MKHNRKHSAKGFTLVELAIVLVIIGLIAGGVLVGQDLIRTSELRGFVSDIDKYTAAVNTFRDKYGAVPGDFMGATAIWGAVDSDPVACLASEGTGTATCNGNGNRVLELVQEPFLFWEHMANDGLIDVAISSVSSTEVVIGENAPSSDAAPAGGFLATIVGSSSGSPDIYDGQYGNIFLYGGAISGNPNIAPVFSTLDMRYVDEKRDDGRPGTGTIVVGRAGGAINPTCATDPDPAVAIYNDAAVGSQCTVIIKEAY